MSLKYLLDTNTLSAPFLKDPDPGVTAKIKQHAAEISIASVVLHELLYGYYRLAPCRRKKELERYIKDVVSRVPSLPYEENAARWHAQERARLSHQTPAFADGQIAAVAAVNGLVIVTRNVSDFRPFAVTIENWFSR